MPEFGELLGVELFALGTEWPAMPEPVAVTLEHMVDMMVAANDDPLIRRPRIKLGHEKWQLTETGIELQHDGYDPYWQGEPSMGSVQNLRLNDAGTRLLGDLVDMPAWMAEYAPSAWPNRSPEWVFNVQTEGGKTYSAVCTAIALLGVQQQAIKSLADLRRVVTQGPDAS